MECWIYNEKTNTYICSVCNTEIEHDYDFCPICGYRHHMTTTIDKYIEELKEKYEEIKEEYEEYLKLFNT